MQSEIVEAIATVPGGSRVEFAEAVRGIERAHGPTFGEYAARWTEKNEGAWSKGSLKSYRSRLRTHVLPRLGDRPVDGLTVRELAGVVNAVSNGSRNVVKIIVRGAMDMALAEGACGDVAGRALDALIVREKATTEHLDALAVEDAPAFFQSLGDTPGELAFKLVKLTAVRINAVSGGSLAEVEDGVWTVDPARQSGRKSTPRVPLSPQASACLDGLGVAPDAIRRHVAGKPFTVHGMRSTFRQWCEREKVRYEVAETALVYRLLNQ